jgi:hypothetical protein
MISDSLREFLQNWLTWATVHNGTPKAWVGEYQFIHAGLCCQVPRDCRREFESFLPEDLNYPGYSDAYPFALDRVHGRDYYTECEVEQTHTNPRRLEFVQNLLKK